jgi:acetyl-CoA C-acetyltransferase
MRRVAVVGTGQTVCGRRDDVSYPELIYEAVKNALEDAGLSIKDVDAVITGSMPAPMEGIGAPHLYWADAVGAYQKPIIRVATCGTTGGSIAHCGYYHVASGLFDVVLVVGAEKMYENDPQATMNTVVDYRYERPFLGGAPAVFAMQAMEYAHRYGISLDELAEAAAILSVKSHLAALDNPYAHIKVKITVDDVLKSRVIAYPIRLYDICPISDGACAVILASEKKARKITDTPAWILGLSYRGDESLFADKDSFADWLCAIEAAREAYKMAKIENPQKQIDVAEVYNPFTYQELTFYECFGFAGKGEAVKLVREGFFDKGGELPTCPSGGVLCTNPIGAAGLQRIAEAALQVMGKAGRRQVPDVEVAFAHAMGGAYQFNSIFILGR